MKDKVEKEMRMRREESAIRKRVTGTDVSCHDSTQLRVKATRCSSWAEP